MVGSSGSGKSLLAHGILGILPYNSAMEGTILYRREPLTQRRAEALRAGRSSWSPRGSPTTRYLRVPQVRRGRRDAAAREESRSILARYGLGAETEELYPFELSGGMARRVLIATAAVEHPKLLIADEPTPGLDARAAGRILGHFRELAEDGAGVLLITHDLELALTIAHRVLVLYAGETIEEAGRRRLFSGKAPPPLHPGPVGCSACLRTAFAPSPAPSPTPGRFRTAASLPPGAPAVKSGADPAAPFPTCPRRAAWSAAMSRKEEIPHEPGSPQPYLPLPRRGKGPVLEHVNLTLEPGEHVGLTASSGRGKTTLCKLLAGYERPTEGEVLLDGRPLSQYRGACPVQMIWQHPETVLDPLLPLEESLKEAGPVEERLLEELHIQPQWLRRYPQELSGGELQRFCIARALGRATRYLLCDEINALSQSPHHPGPDLGFPPARGGAAESGAAHCQPQRPASGAGVHPGGVSPPPPVKSRLSS